MANEDASKLFVAGLPDSVTEDVLRRLFEATGGTVVSVSLPKDRATGRPRGFGFVTLGSSEEAASARSALDGSVQAGRAISVRPFQSEPPRRGEGRPSGDAPASSAGASEDRTLYVGNLPYDVTQQEIEALFSEHGAGPVARIHLPVGPDGRPRGFGFVSLASSDAANQAISALRDVEVRGRRLMINIANPRGSGGGGGAGGFRGGAARGPRPMHDEPPLEPRAPDRHEAKARFGEAPEETEEGGGGGEGKQARAAGAGKKKKEKEKGKPSKRERGGGGSWQKWTDWDED